MPKSAIKSGERRTATILFADMKGFTSLSERMDPEEMDTLMNRVFGTFEEIIKSNGGIVEKYIGDALVAVFGVPELHEDDPIRAIESALEFLERNRALSRELAGKAGDVQFRVGIHSGLIATGTRGDFDVVTGHAMTVAQRLQSEAEPNGILVSDALRENCESDFDFSGPLELTVRGKSEKIRAWAVRGAAVGESAETGPFVGRKEILEDLLRLYIKDDTSIITGRYIVGEAGMGKTRLVQALIERIRKFPDFNSPVLRARAQGYRNSRYAVVSDLITEYLGLEPYSQASEIRAALAKVPGVADEHIRRFVDLLDPKKASAADPDLVLSLFSVFSAIMENHASSMYSSFVFVDNAQALDRLSREFFQYYFKNGRIKPFVIMAGREHPQNLRDAFADLKGLRLGVLSGEDAKALALAHLPEGSAALLDAIVSQGMGNPLFIREYALFARKHKDLSNLPDTIQNIFLTSLERYDGPTRDLVMKLSVFLLHFSADDARRIQKASDEDETIVDRALKRLVQDGVLNRAGDYYNFTLDVFKKALYASLLNHNKRIIHSLIADIMLEGENPTRLRLIHHLMHAERWLEASQIMRRDPARTYTYEYLAYIDTLHRNLAKAAPEDAVQLLILKSSLFFNSGKIEEAELELKRIMRSALAQKNDNSMGFAYHMICALNTMAYAFQKAQFTGQKALYYYRRSAMSARSVQNVVRYIAFAEMMRNNFQEARTLIEQMKDIPEFDDFEYTTARAEYRALSGDYHGALALLDGQACLNEGDCDYEVVARFFGMDQKLKILWQLCDFAALGPAARAMLDAGALSEMSMAGAHAMLAVSQNFTGDKKSASESFLQAEFYADLIRNDYDRIDALRTLALCHFISGEEKKAEAFAMEGMSLGLRHSCYFPTFTLAMVLVQIQVRRNKSDEARFFLREASYFFTTGLLLPYKDVILYYYYSSQLFEGKDSERSATIAYKLIEDEKGRIREKVLVDGFLSTRGYGEIQKNLARLTGVKHE